MDNRISKGAAIMRCERVQELILTDYIDGELDENIRSQVREHILACPECHSLELAVSENAVYPFASSARVEPPAYILERVKERIASEEAGRVGVLEDARRMIARAFSSVMNIPKPVVVLAATTMVIIAIMIARPLTDRPVVSDYLSEQASFIANLDADEANGSTIFDTDIKTGAEKFL